MELPGTVQKLYLDDLRGAAPPVSLEVGPVGNAAEATNEAVTKASNGAGKPAVGLRTLLQRSRTSKVSLKICA